jgi:heptosyltransferase III
MATSTPHSPGHPSGTLWIVHPGALGDWILTWPALRCLRKAYPLHRFLGIGRPDYMKLAVRFALLDDFADGESRDCIPLFSGTGLPENLAPPDGAVVWMKNADPLLLLLKTSSTLPVVALDPIPGEAVRHVAQVHCESLAKEFPIRIPDDLTEGFPEHEPRSQYVFIHPGSGSAKKNFSPNFYENIAYYLRENGHSKIAFLMGPVEIDLGMAEAFKNQSLIFPEDTQALADWLENAVLHIGNDSGVSHLAGYMGIPSVVLYRSTDPGIWGALGRRVYPVIADDESEAFEKVIGRIAAIR